MLLSDDAAWPLLLDNSNGIVQSCPCVNVLHVLSYHMMQNVYTVMFEGKLHYMIHLPIMISPQHKWLFP